MSQSLRWGIVGASEIAHDFCVALNYKFTRSDHKIVAVASRSKAKAERLAKENEISRVWTNYKDLAADDQVEVVYVSVIIPLRHEICKMMIEYGKHIVCEKPLCMNRQQLRDILEKARLKRVFVMEGLWSRFFPVYRHLHRIINMKALTNVKEVYVKHGYIANGMEGLMKKENGGGIVLDIGIDAIQFVLFIYREEPKSIKASGKINSDGVDLQIQVDMLFSGDRKATIICSGLQAFDNNQATVISKKGPVCIPDYNCPTKLFGCNGAHEWSLVKTDVPMNFKNSLGLRYEADEVMKCIRSGKLDCEIVPPREMMLIAQIRDEIRKQIGVRYDCDNSKS